jgi:hypothetical protein
VAQPHRWCAFCFSRRAPRNRQTMMSSQCPVTPYRKEISAAESLLIFEHDLQPIDQTKNGRRPT